MNYVREDEETLAPTTNHSAKSKELEDLSACLALLWAVEHSKNPQQIVTVTYVKNWLLNKSRQLQSS